MPPRRRVVTPSEPKTASPSPGPASQPADREFFGVDDVSGSDDSDHGDVGVNDPDTIPIPQGGAGAYRYFFDKSGVRTVCRVCR